MSNVICPVINISYDTVRRTHENTISDPLGEPVRPVRAVSLLPVSVSGLLGQVGFFKITHGKRLFKMAPIHHHFEKCGWSEIRIVAIFATVTLLLSFLTFFFVYL